MGILSRFKTIMASNVNAYLDKSKDPAKEIDAYMRELDKDLRQVKAETASVLTEERRARRLLDECNEEIDKLHRYAVKSVADGDEGQARRFLERKKAQADKQRQLQVAYDLAAANAASMRQMQDKLESDMGRLEARRASLKGKLAEVEAQQKMNRAGFSSGMNGSVFDELEERVNRAHDEALALAELRGEPKDALDEKFAQLERESRTMNEDDELAAIKEQLKNQQQ